MSSVTERAVLDLLHGRMCALGKAGERRYALAEHVRLDPTFPRRIIDAVAVDMWRSRGFGWHGFEVKVSRSDLRREIANPAKSGAFMEWLDSFTIVAPAVVLKGWADMGIPDRWGLMAADDGATRYIRRPAEPGYEEAARTLPIGLVASLSRSIAYTASRHCARLENLA